MSKEAEAPGKTKAINPSCGTQDQNENGIFPKSEWEDAALHLCKRQINRDGEKKTAPDGFRIIIRRGELYGFNNGAIAFGGHVNFFERTGIIPSEADRYH